MSSHVRVSHLMVSSCTHCNITLSFDIKIRVSMQAYSYAYYVISHICFHCETKIFCHALKILTALIFLIAINFLTN